MVRDAALRRGAPAGSSQRDPQGGAGAAAVRRRRGGAAHARAQRGAFSPPLLLPLPLFLPLPLSAQRGQRHSAAAPSQPGLDLRARGRPPARRASGAGSPCCAEGAGRAGRQNAPGGGSGGAGMGRGAAPAGRCGAARHDTTRHGTAPPHEGPAARTAGGGRRRGGAAAERPPTQGPAVGAGAGQAPAPCLSVVSRPAAGAECLEDRGAGAARVWEGTAGLAARDGLWRGAAVASGCVGAGGGAGGQSRRCGRQWLNGVTG